MNNEAVTHHLTTFSNKCPKCHGSGWEYVDISTEYTRETYGDDRKLEYAIPCSYCNGGHAEKVELFRKGAKIPTAYYKSKLSEFDWNIYQDNQGKQIDTTKQRRIVKEFIDQFEAWERRGMGLYIHSKMRGSGKTFLASCICNSLIEKYPMKTKFVSASELIEIQKQGTSTGTEYERDPIEMLCDCKLLVIDDLGQKQSGADWTNDILFRIMDNRMQKSLVTIITSNLSIAELQIDDRIVDRINKVCISIRIPEFCVRSREARQNQIELFQELGIIDAKKEGESA